jgi:hypothetical protein
MNQERPDKRSASNIFVYIFLSILGLIVLFWVGSFLETRIFTPETEGSQSPFQPRLAQEANDS